MRGIHRKKFDQAFTLFETIAVIAVVGVLAICVTAYVLTAISEANIAVEVTNLRTLQASAESYVRKYHGFADTNGADIGAILMANNGAYDHWETVLLREQLLEKGFASKLATNAYIRLTMVNTNSDVDPVGWGTVGSVGNLLGNNGAYDLTHEYELSESESLGNDAFIVAGNVVSRESVPPFFNFESYLDLSRQARNPLRGVIFRGQVGPKGGATGVRNYRTRLTCGGIRPLQGILQAVPKWTIPFSPPAPAAGTSLPPGGYTTPTHGPTTAHNDVASGVVVAEVVLQGISIRDVYRLSLALDGWPQSNWAYWDSQGRVTTTPIIESVRRSFI